MAINELDVVYINGTTFAAVVSIDYGQDIRAPSRKTEAGFTITDHMEVELPTFSLRLYLDKAAQEPETLKAIVEVGDRITLTTRFGHFGNVVVDHITMSNAESASHMQASIDAHQIAVALPKFAAMALPVPVTTGTESTDAGAATAPGAATTEEVVPESIIDGFIAKPINSMVSVSDTAKEAPATPYSDSDVIGKDY